MSNNINNQYDFFKLVNLDANGNIGVVVSGGTGGGGSQPFSFTAANRSALLALTGMADGDLAYVVNSEGTAWLPGTSGGSYYPKGIYIYSGGAWVSDRNAISLQLSLDDDRLDAIEADIANAIHTNEPNEISGITAKATPTASDILLIEDAADGNNKKKITIGDLPSTVGTTNLSVGNKTSTTLDVESSTGTNATIPSVTTSEAGLSSAADKIKLDGIEAGADVTDATNVNAAGALMESEVTNISEVKAFDSTDYATAAQGTTADNALPKAGGAMTGPITTNSTFDGRDVATDGTKLDGIEAGATTDQTLTKTLTLQSPTAADNISVFRTDVDITVQEVITVSNGTIPSTTYQLKHNPTRSNVGNDLTISTTTTSTTTGDIATLSDATIPANSWIWLETSAASGVNVYLTVDIRYTED